MADSVNIEPISLSQTLEKLAKDNANIDNTLNNINILMSELDKSKWNAPEKDRIDAEIIPYLESQRNNITTGVNNCVAVIKKAKDIYVATNNSLLRVAETLENYSSSGDGQ